MQSTVPNCIRNSSNNTGTMNHQTPKIFKNRKKIKKISKKFHKLSPIPTKEYPISNPPPKTKQKTKPLETENRTNKQTKTKGKTNTLLTLDITLFCSIFSGTKHSTINSPKPIKNSSNNTSTKNHHTQ